MERVKGLLSGSSHRFHRERHPPRQLSLIPEESVFNRFGRGRRWRLGGSMMSSAHISEEKRVPALQYRVPTRQCRLDASQLRLVCLRHPICRPPSPCPPPSSPSSSTRSPSTTSRASRPRRHDLGTRRARATARRRTRLRRRCPHEGCSQAEGRQALVLRAHPRRTALEGTRIGEYLACYGMH